MVSPYYLVTDHHKATDSPGRAFPDELSDYKTKLSDEVNQNSTDKSDTFIAIEVSTNTVRNEIRSLPWTTPPVCVHRFRVRWGLDLGAVD